MKPLPRNEAKERILAIMRERADRIRYIITPPEERDTTPLDLRREIGIKEPSHAI